MATEITSESTHEDITQAVDAIIKDRQGDTSDAVKIAEERDEPVTETSAETDSGSDDTASDGEDTGEDQSPKWLDDDLRAELAAYGIDETGLSDFSSREELERAMRFFDKSALEAGRKAMAEGNGETPVRDDKGRFQKKAEPEPVAEAKEGKYEISLDKDVYDEDLVNELTRMRDHYETRLSTLETRIAEQDAIADQQHFDSLVDSLGHGDLFGTTGKENSKQLQRRQDLHVAVQAQQIGLKVMGRDVDLDKSLVNRVARMVFAEDISKKELKARTRKISEQSANRMGGGATRATGPSESLRDEMRRRYKELEGAG